MTTVEAHMRNGVTGEVSPLEVDPSITSATAVIVPGFGALLVDKVRSDELIDRLHDHWLGLLVQPDANNEYSPASNRVHREGHVVGSTIEIELLPNSSKEDRLVVCIDGLVGGGEDG